MQNLPNFSFSHIAGQGQVKVKIIQGPIVGVVWKCLHFSYFGMELLVLANKLYITLIKT